MSEFKAQFVAKQRRSRNIVTQLSSPAVMTADTTRTMILLAVLTTGARNGPLTACIEAIAKMLPVENWQLEIVIVQNGSWQITEDVAGLRDKGPIQLDVVLEPRKGIPPARNRAIQEAMIREANYVAFIDDDAWPDADWLVEAVRVLRETGAHAVTGPQIPVFPTDAPARLHQAAIYKAANHPTDRPCTWAASNNVIFSLEFVREHGLAFDETFTTGGSDKEYFRRFVHAGGTIRWAPTSIVREPVVPERLKLTWAIHRSYRLGTSGFRIESATHSMNRARAICLGKGGCYIAGGLALLPLALVPRHPGPINGLCYLAHGAGFILGLTARFRPKRYI